MLGIECEQVQQMGPACLQSGHGLPPSGKPKGVPPFLLRVLKESSWFGEKRHNDRIPNERKSCTTGVKKRKAPQIVVSSTTRVSEHAPHAMVGFPAISELDCRHTSPAASGQANSCAYSHPDDDCNCGYNTPEAQLPTTKNDWRIDGSRAALTARSLPRHNISHQVPQGSRALAGTAVINMAAWIYPQNPDVQSDGWRGVPGSARRIHTTSTYSQPW